jgi:hypothetical protein
MIQKVSNKIQLNHTNENISTFASGPSLIKEIARPFGAWSRDVIVTKLFNDNFCFIPFLIDRYKNISLFTVFKLPIGHNKRK